MANQDELAELTIAGQSFTAWTSISVRRDYGTPASVFAFAMSEPNEGRTLATLKRIQPGDDATVSLAGIQVVKGNVTTRSTAYDRGSHEILIQGRSLTADLVDSSVKVKSGEANNYVFESIARAKLEPFPVKLILKNPPPDIARPFPKVVINPGESVFEFLERLGRMRGLIFCDDENGNLVAGQIDPKAAPVAELEEGRNIKFARATLDDQTLFSKYSVVMQGRGSDTVWPPRDVQATVENPLARSWREKVITGEQPGDQKDAQGRADYEAARSLWPVVDCTVGVQGWTRGDGRLWGVADIVTVKSPMLFPNAEGSIRLGIQAVTFTQDDQNGTMTVIDLRLPTGLSSTPDPGLKDGAAPNILSDPRPSQAKPDAQDEG